MNFLKNNVFKRVALLSLLAVFASTLVTCKKYPDGPWLSFKSKDKRLSGVWQLGYFYMNGNDITDSLLNDPYFGKENYVFSFFRKENNGNMGLINTSLYPKEINWSFVKRKKYLKIDIEYSPNVTYPYKPIGPYRAPSSEWRILKLTDKDLWMECEWNGSIYKFELKNKYPYNSGI